MTNPDHVVSIVVPWLENGDMHIIDCHPNSSLYLTVLFLTVLILCTCLVSFVVWFMDSTESTCFAGQ